MLKVAVRLQLQLGTLEVLAGVEDILQENESLKLHIKSLLFISAHLHSVEAGVLLDQPEEVVDALQRCRGAAGLEDEPAPGHEHGALAQHVRVQLAVAGGRDDAALDVAQHPLQLEPESEFEGLKKAQKFLHC